MKVGLRGLLVFIFMLISSCSRSSRVQSSQLSSPQPDPQSAVATESISAPLAGKGVITGVLREGTGDPQPVGKAILYLADIVTSTDGRRAAATFDRNTSPNTQTDANGRFVFSDVAPGEYALVLDRIYSSVLLNNPVDQGDLLFTAVAGKTVDLGNLDYPSLPDSTLQ